MEALTDFVDSFAMLHNSSSNDRKVIVLPDGRVDLLLVASETSPFQIALPGIETQPSHIVLAQGTRVFSANFKLLSAEYLFHRTMAHILNEAESLADGFWGLHADDLNNFDLFCNKITQQVLSLIPGNIDGRKLELSQLVYDAKGEIPVRELADRVYWSSRQINRYFTQHNATVRRGCKPGHARRLGAYRMPDRRT